MFEYAIVCNNTFHAVNRRCLEQRPQRKLHAKRFAHPRDNSDCQKRVATEIEEVVVAPNAVEMEEFGPDLGDGGLDGSFGLRVTGRAEGEKGNHVLQMV